MRSPRPLPLCTISNNMKITLFSSLRFFLALSLYRFRVSSETILDRDLHHASFPPRGWNSYDSFCWTISEEEFLQSAEIISKRLLHHGYKYVVVDYLWYRRKVPGAYTDSLGFDVIDEWGRMIPDPDRWPSSRGGKGFTEVAKKVHSMGLKFGIHVMRGISTQAFNANTPILNMEKGGAYVEAGRQWRAKDIGIKERACAWMPHGFMSVNTKLGAGRAFLRSLYKQYAEWGVDFVKNDCVFGDDLDIDEISFVSEVLKELDRPILYSLSPGTSVTPAMAKKVNGLVNMYRITGDDWDTWGDVAAHFNIARDFSAANMIGVNGLQGKSWPDLDMIPLGWLTDPGSNEGPHRPCNLNIEEQRTQMTLWAMARSPLMFGGDVRKLDDTTYALITNPTALEINSFSSNNKEFPYITGAEKLTQKNKVISSYLSDRDKSTKHALSLSSCEDSEAKGWSNKTVDQDLEQVCWKEKSGDKIEEPLCLYKRKPLLASDEETLYDQRFQEKLHLLTGEANEFCLDASPKQRLTAKEFKRGSFSPCRRDANQMWELNSSGALRNSYSGLCAIVNSVKGNFSCRFLNDSGKGFERSFSSFPLVLIESSAANVGLAGVRSWIATGRQGEIYLAFFNLNNEKTVISANIADLGKALPKKNFNGASCKCREVWSGKDHGVLRQSISQPVERHGCALFVLRCGWHRGN